jgi:hypothetical protein
MKTQEIRNYNQKNQFHGYQEWCYEDGNIRFRCIYKNGLEVGYEEWHNNQQTNFHIR